MTATYWLWSALWVWAAITVIGFCWCWAGWAHYRDAERSYWEGSNMAAHHRAEAESMRRAGLRIWAWPVLLIAALVASLYGFITGRTESES